MARKYKQKLLQKYIPHVAKKTIANNTIQNK